MSAPTASVVRDGQTQRVPSAELVKGDLLVLAEGDAIAADARLVRAASLRVQESSLTATPLEKEIAHIGRMLGIAVRWRPTDEDSERAGPDVLDVLVRRRINAELAQDPFPLFDCLVVAIHAAILPSPGLRPVGGSGWSPLA